MRFLALILSGCILLFSLPPSLYHDLLEDHTLEHDFRCIAHHADLGTHFDAESNSCLFSDGAYEVQTLLFLFVFSIFHFYEVRKFQRFSENLILILNQRKNGRAPPYN
jgi:hypothetical protein